MQSSMLDNVLCTKQATTSGMFIDRCHEQDNGAVKASDGAVGLTANPAAFRGRTVTLTLQDILQHLKRIGWPEDQEPN